MAERTVDDVFRRCHPRVPAPTRAWPRRCSSPSPCSGPCCSRARPGSGKTEVAKVLARVDRRARCCASSATRASTCPRPSTSGTTPASSCTCGPPRPAAWTPARRRTSCTASGSSSAGRCCWPSTTARARRRCCSIDEVDRADDEFEAFLLEFLSEYAVTIPELGTFRAPPTGPPLVVLTSNRTRDVHDALKRRCLYHWVEHPDFEREVAIVRLRAPQVGRRPGPPGRRRRRGHAGAWSSTSPRAWPRRSTGRPPWPPSAGPSSTSTPSTSPWAPCSSTARIRSGCGRRGSAR